ncbi:MAG: LysM peptidoglycan-binding domain-containing protein [Planctomycetes bacterium]|nr:LysM peptidoglycan-binding domain-containing protein [Planctomycetota bacterium]
MGNLEKAGVGVVVALLLIIMGVAFTTDPQTGEPMAEPEQAAPLAVERETDSQDDDVLIDPRVLPGVTVEGGGGGESRDVLNPTELVEGDQPLEELIDPGTRPVTRTPDEPTPTPELSDSEALPSQPSEWPKSVIVAKNDSLWRIAARHYGRNQADLMVSAVREFNGLTSDILRPKQKIRLPAPLPSRSGESVATRGGSPGSARVRPASVAGLPWEPGASVYGPSSGISADGRYVVKQNESLSQIAARELGSVKFVKDIMKLNGIKNPDRIAVGMRLKMPAKKKKKNP